MSRSAWCMRCVAGFVLLLASVRPAGAAVYQYAVQEGGRTVYLWVPPPCLRIRGLIVAFRNLTEPLWLEDPLIRAAATDTCLGIVWIGQGEHSGLDANMSASAGEAFLTMQRDLAAVSGFPEIANAPVIATGHSAQGQFAWKFAQWAPDRTIASIPVKTVPLPRDLNLGPVPLLYAVGETTEWPQFRDGSRPGDRDFFWPVVQSSATTLRARDPQSRIAVVTDPGGGHFDWSPALAQAVALFIRKACALRLPPDAPGQPILRNLPLNTGWLMDAQGLHPERFPAAPYDQYTGPREQAFWVFDRSMAEVIAAVAGDHIARRHQMLSFQQDGTTLPVATQGFAPLRFEPGPDGITFSLHPVFLQTIPKELVHAGEPLGHAPGPIRLRVICGPVRQLGPDRFELAWDREAMGGEAWIEEQQDGDAVYRKAVQPAKLLIPSRLNEGASQTIAFTPIRDRKASSTPIELHAKATSGLPVRFFVLAGPATISGNRLHLAELPRGGASSIEITVVAYQWGQSKASGHPAIQTAEPVRTSFHILSRPH